MGYGRVSIPEAGFKYLYGTPDMSRCHFLEIILILYKLLNDSEPQHVKASWNDRLYTYPCSVDLDFSRDTLQNSPIYAAFRKVNTIYNSNNTHLHNATTGTKSIVVLSHPFRPC